MATKKLGVQNNKAKSRRQSRDIKSGKYEKQKSITEANRKRKQAKHLKYVEKKHPTDVGLFIL